MVQALINVWVLWDPLRYLTKGDPPRFSLRYVNLLVLAVICILVAALGIIEE